MSNEPVAELRELVIITADLAGFAKLATTLDPIALATMLDGYYREVEGLVTDAGGRVVKFIGDGTLATFERDDVVAAVACAQKLAAIDGPAHGLTASVRVHLATVAAGPFGADGTHDIAGDGVNQAFLMGHAPGVRLSEAVYYALPPADGKKWRAQRRPPIYAPAPSDDG